MRPAERREIAGVGEFGAGAVASIHVITGVKGGREGMAGEPMELLSVEDNASDVDRAALGDEA